MNLDEDEITTEVGSAASSGTFDADTLLVLFEFACRGQASSRAMRFTMLLWSVEDDKVRSGLRELYSGYQSTFAEFYEAMFADAPVRLVEGLDWSDIAFLMTSALDGVSIRRRIDPEAAKPELVERVLMNVLMSSFSRRPGKQPGSDGKHLERVADPDVVIDHVPSCCAGCGNDLDAGTDVGSVARQVFDIPAPKVVVTEHRAIKRRCGCGTVTTGTFPDGVTAPATYGPRVRAAALYLTARQHVPFERTSEAIADLFGLSVSTGWLDTVNTQAADGLKPFLTAVGDQLKSAVVIGVDETSDRVGLDTWWFHVARTDQLTLLHADRTRGRAGVEATGVINDCTATMIHDRLGLYWNHTNASHGLCNAHLLRNLASVGEVWDQTWALDMAALLRDTKTLADTARTKGRSSLSRRQLADIDRRYTTIIDTAIAATPDPVSGRKRNSLEREAHNLALAFRDHQQPILLFSRDLAVPFDNNGAERDLRMVKLHQKISGSFRSGQGAKRLAAVRSYISTGRKQQHNILDLLTTLTTLTTGHPWIPPPLRR